MTSPNEPEFGGRIGRTRRDSTPWWPDPPPGLGGPNVVIVVLDDTGFAHFGCYGSELAQPGLDIGRDALSPVRSTGRASGSFCGRAVR